MLNLSHVKTFVTVIDEGGFHEAARKLELSQPSVTQHIKKLETALKASLIVRSHASCTPTTNGSRFLPHARRLLEIATRAQDTVIRNDLAIGASNNIGTYLLQPHLKKFIDASGPDMSTSIKLDRNPQLVEQLTDGQIDIALMEWWDDRPGFNATIWHREHLKVIVSPDHLWARNQTLSQDELFSTPMIGGEAGSGTATLLKKVFGADARRLKISMTLGSTEAVKHAVMANLGVSIVFEGSVHQEVKSGRLVALDVDDAELIKDLYAVVPSSLHSDSHAHAFESHLRANIP